MKLIYLLHSRLFVVFNKLPILSFLIGWQKMIKMKTLLMKPFKNSTLPKVFSIFFLIYSEVIGSRWSSLIGTWSLQAKVSQGQKSKSRKFLVIFLLTCYSTIQNLQSSKHILALPLLGLSYRLPPIWWRYCLWYILYSTLYLRFRTLPHPVYKCNCWQYLFHQIIYFWYWTRPNSNLFCIKIKLNISFFLLKMICEFCKDLLLSKQFLP